MDNRYDREYTYGKVKFFLSDFTPTIEQCRFLMLKMLEQAVREYCTYANSNVPNEQVTWELARDFLYDDDYRFMWGDIECSLESFLDMIDLDIGWVREQTRRRLERSNG